MARRHDDTPSDQTVRWANGGFAIVPNALIETMPDSIQVYAALARYADRAGRCFPGLDRLADDLGVSRSTVKRRVYALRDAGWLTIERRGAMDTNVYVIHESASDGSDLNHHDGSPVAHHDGSPMTHKQEPAREQEPVDEKPSTTRATSGPRDARPVPKSQSLVGESRQTTRRRLRTQRSKKGEPASGTVIPSKPKRESTAEMAARVLGVDK